MDTLSTEDTNIILGSIFFHCNNNNEYKILRDSTRIPDLYKILNMLSGNLDDKITIVKALKTSFENIRHYMAVFSKFHIITESNERLDIFLILLHQYVQYSDEKHTGQSVKEKEYLDLILIVLDLLLANVTCPIEAYDYIYSLFYPYLSRTSPPDTKVLTPKLFKNYFTLLSRIYGSNIQKTESLSPHNYIYLSGKDGIFLFLGENENGKEVYLSFNQSFSICLWFKIGINKSDMYSFFNKKEIDLINIIQKNNTSTRIFLDDNNTMKCSFDPELSVDLEANTWNFLIFSWCPNQGIQFEININKKISSKIIEVPDIQIQMLFLFTNFIGEVSSIVLVQGNQLKDLIKIFSQKTFRYGIKSEKEFIQFNKGTKRNIFQNYQSTFLENIRMSAFNYINQSSNIKFLYFASRHIQEKSTSVILKDSSIDAHLKMDYDFFNGVNIYKRHYRSISQINGLYPLLPIAEMISLSVLNNSNYPYLGNILTNDIMNDYLQLIQEIILKQSKNRSNKEIVRFFQFLSLILERLPSSFLSNELFNIFCSLISGDDVEMVKNNETLSMINQIIVRVFLNKRLFFKFNPDIQIKIWDVLNKHYTWKTIGKSFDMVTIVSFILEMDKEKYTKFCCSKHANAYIDVDITKTYDIEPKLNSMRSFILTILNQKQDGIKILADLLTREISPCLQLFVIKLISFYFEDKQTLKSQQELNVIRNLFNSNLIVQIPLFTLSVSSFDVRIEIINLIMMLVLNHNVTLSSEQIIYIQTHLVPVNTVIQQDTKPKIEIKPPFEKVSLNEKNLENETENEPESRTTSFQSRESEWEKLNNFGFSENSDNFYEKNDPQSNYSIITNDPIKDINMIKLIGFTQITLKSNDEYLSKSLNQDVFSSLSREMFDFLILRLPDSNLSEIIIHLIIKICPYCDIVRNSTLVKVLKDESNDLIELCSSSKPIYHWLLETTFQVFILQDAKLKGALTLHSPQTTEEDVGNESQNFINNAIELYSKICRKKISILDYFLQWCNYYKELYRNDNNYDQRLEELIITIFEKLIYNILSLDIQHSDHNDKTEQDFLYLFSIYFEYLTVFKIGNHFNNEKKIVNDIPEYYSSIFTICQDGTSKPIHSKWRNYETFKLFSDKCFEMWRDLFTKRDPSKIVDQYLNDSNEFYNELSILILENYGSINCTTNKGIPLIFIISNMMMTIINEIELESELESWMSNYCDFLYFIIVASINVDQNDPKYRSMQILSKNVLAVGMCFLIYQLNKKKLSLSSIIFKSIKDLLSLIFSIIQKINQMVNNKNSLSNLDKGFNMIKSILKKEKSDPKIDCAVFEVFKDIFSQNCVNKFKNTLSSDIKIKEFLNGTDVREALVENKSYWTSVNKIFIFDKIYNERRRTIGDIFPIYPISSDILQSKHPIIRTDSNYVDDRYFLVKKSITELTNPIGKRFNKNYEIFKIKTNFEKDQLVRKYHKIKAEMFTFRGLWSQKELFYDKREKLKYKILHHLTKDYSRPLIYPVIDYEHYLPNFSNFNKKDLFFDKKNAQNLIDLDLRQYFSESKDDDGQEVLSVIDEPTHILKRIHAGVFEGILNENNEKNIKKSKNAENYKNFIETKMNISKDITDKLKNDTNELNHCCLVKATHHIKGYIHNDSKGIGFYAYEWEYDRDNDLKDGDRDSCFGSTFKNQLNKRDNYHIFIPYNKIERMFKRRYLFRHIAFEIYTINKKSFYISFWTQTDRDSFWTRLINKIGAKTINIENREFIKEIGFENKSHLFFNCKDSLNAVSIRNKVELWSEWKISTMEMIMYLNIVANRSYCDLMQYPVFPWILTDYKSDNPYKEIRDFSQPVGMFEVFPESKNRKENYMKQYDNMVSDNDDSNEKETPYVYGTHYSNSMYVSYYLMRIFPFSQLKVELQGNCFDNPNRLFNSIETSFYCVSTQKADVRELIPEFFCLPEMFLNLNDFDFGELLSEDQKQKVRVKSVKLPNWCKNDPYIFIENYRRQLESSDVNCKISSWFDIIFGVKQRGDKAKQIYNLFLEETYEDFEKRFKQLDRANKDYKSRMIEFGVTPHQIFNYKLDKRKTLEEIKATNQFTTTSLKETYIILKSEERYDLKIDDFCVIKALEKDQRLLLLSPTKVAMFKYGEKYENETKNTFYAYTNGFGLIGNSLQVPSYCSIDKIPIQSYNNGECLIKGGYINGQLFVQNSIERKDTKIKYYIQKDMSPITIIAIDQEEKFILCGTLSGLVHIYFISQLNSPIDLELIRTLRDHRGSITSININNRLNIFATASSDGFIMLYTMPHCKLFNLIKMPTNSHINHLLISSSPLPCVVFFNETDSTWNSYSINGKQLIEPMKSETVVNAKIFTNVNFLDYIVKLY